MKKNNHNRYFQKSIPFICISMLIILFNSSCYRFSLSSLPSYIKTFNINLLENKTTKPSLNLAVKSTVTAIIREKSQLLLVANKAHSTINLTINSYENTEDNLSGGQITSRKIKIAVEVSFINNLKKDTLFYEKNLLGFALYSIINGETETDGRQRAINNLAKLISDNTILGW